MEIVAASRRLRRAVRQHECELERNAWVAAVRSQADEVRHAYPKRGALVLLGEVVGDGEAHDVLFHSTTRAELGVDLLGRRCIELEESACPCPPRPFAAERSRMQASGGERRRGGYQQQPQDTRAQRAETQLAPRRTVSSLLASFRGSGWMGESRGACIELGLTELRGVPARRRGGVPCHAAGGLRCAAHARRTRLRDRKADFPVAHGGVRAGRVCTWRGRGGCARI